LPSGNPAGLRVASLTTRTVRVFEIPRSLLSEFLKRRESSRVGVYYLFGPESEEGRLAYIGQSGNVGKRLQEHAASKDWWTKAMVAVSLTDEWTSTHVAYLEWLSVDRATKAGRYKLDNLNQGSNPHTPEPLEADCNEFLETIGVLLATLGVPILEQVQETVTEGTPGQELLYFREAGCDATGYQTPEGLLVLRGSVGRADLRRSATPPLRRLRDALREQGVYEVRDERMVFVKDHLFSSPSAAGGFLVGGANNGRTSWKNAAGTDLNHIEARELDAATSVAVQAELTAEGQVGSV
jgi:hypothetical protein